MKTKNLLTFLILIVCSANPLFAVDRVVQQSGPVGTYASITAAISAAVDGDNIVINNRTDGLPWLENLTINKSLTFVSAVDNIQWWMEGTISITAAEGRSITIVGLRNSSAAGSITKNATNPVNRTVVNILSSDIAGDIVLVSGVNFYLGSSRASGVTFSYGKIYGNDLRQLSVSPDAVTTEDVNQIIGNRIGYWSAPSSTGFYHNSTTQYLYFSNNYCRSVASYGAHVGSLKSGAVTNRIINCTFAAAYTSFYTHQISGLYVSHTSGQLSLENSILAGNYVNSSNGAVGIVITGTASGITTCTYNMYHNYFPVGSTLSTSLNNFIVTGLFQTTVNQDGGYTGGTQHVDAGNPANTWLDLDLTRNDCGVFGGSYSMANFLPLMSNVESSRVNYMNTPRIVNQGGTVNVQVIGYDK